MGERISTTNILFLIPNLFASGLRTGAPRLIRYFPPTLTSISWEGPTELEGTSVCRSGNPSSPSSLS
eukprot:2865116-Ditylum_brightwellii.AAC.1